MYVNTWCLFMSIQNLEELYYGDTIGRGRGGGKSLNEDDDHNRRMTKQCKNILHPFHLASRCSEKKIYLFSILSPTLTCRHKAAIGQQKLASQ